MRAREPTQKASGRLLQWTKRDVSYQSVGEVNCLGAWQIELMMDWVQRVSDREELKMLLNFLS